MDEYNNNKDVCEKRASTIKYFRVVPDGDFDITGNGCLGPTLKLKRPIVSQRYGELIDEMYQPRT